MAYLAVRGSNAVNAVSRLHGEVSRRIFGPLFPGWPIAEVPVGYVTNGVHVPTWDSAASDALWTKAVGKQCWMGDLEGMSERISQIPNEEIWQLRADNRAALVKYVRERYARQLRRDGLAGDEAVEQSRHLFDPNVLTLGFARRFATYKRPTLLLADPERFARILNDPQRPVQMVVAGKAHPADDPGRAMVRQWLKFMERPDVRLHLVFVPDYNIDVAEQLTQGVDVWINNPRRPWEASGTSGMKVLVNGGLNLSELDGWWAEAYELGLGWAIGDGQEHGSDPEWDRHEAEQVYDLLENEIVPTFYHRNERGVPEKWTGMVRSSMAKLTPYFSTNRMVREYVETYYRPLAEAYEGRVAGDQAVGAPSLRLAPQPEDFLEYGAHWRRQYRAARRPLSDQGVAASRRSASRGRARRGVRRARRRHEDGVLHDHGASRRAHRRRQRLHLRRHGAKPPAAARLLGPRHSEQPQCRRAARSAADPVEELRLRGETLKRR